MVLTASVVPSVKAGSIVYYTNFENTTQATSNSLNMGVANVFGFEYLTGAQTGAAMWVEGLDRHTTGISCHSGTHCIGMEITDITQARRAEFNIVGFNSLLGSRDLFLSEWLLLPPNWALHSPTYRWYGLAALTEDNFAPNFWPLIELRIIQNLYTMIYELHLVLIDNNAVTDLGVIPNYVPPTGSWFELEYYVHRDATAGIVQVWIDRSLAFSVTGVKTADPSYPDWYATISKIYYGTNDLYSPYQIWVDDLVIYNYNYGAVEYAPASTTTTSTSAAITTGSSSMAVTTGSSSVTSTSQVTSVITQPGSVSELLTWIDDHPLYVILIVLGVLIIMTRRKPD